MHVEDLRRQTLIEVEQLRRQSFVDLEALTNGVILRVALVVAVMLVLGAFLAMLVVRFRALSMT
jgi:hypothetical protein